MKTLKTIAKIILAVAFILALGFVGNNDFDEYVETNSVPQHYSISKYALKSR